MIRPARPADASALAALQSHLDSPSPELLATFAAFGRCLVSVDVERGSVADGSDLDDESGPSGTDSHVDSAADPASPTAGSDDGRPVGYVLVVGGDDAHIAELVVHPAYRREGRGAALLRGVIDRVEPGTRVTLTVAADNVPARSLYESVGFRSVDSRPGFYEATDAEHSEDAVVYAYDVQRGGQLDGPGGGG